MKDARPDCSRCQHYFVTYDAAAPRGCRAYGFKSLQWPTRVVLESSGAPCRRFEERGERRREAFTRR